MRKSVLNLTKQAASQGRFSLFFVDFLGIIIKNGFRIMNVSFSKLFYEYLLKDTN